MAGRAAHDMTEGPVFGHILRMIMPMSFGILAMMLVGKRYDDAAVIQAAHAFEKIGNWKKM